MAGESTDSGDQSRTAGSSIGFSEFPWLSSGPPSTEEGDDGFGFPPNGGNGETLPVDANSLTHDWLSSIDTYQSPTVPGYEILGLIGWGGMGAVYKALQCRANRLVALKMIRGGSDLHSDQVSSGSASRSRPRALLHHPNVVQIYDVGETDGRPYFSLELLEGGTLKQRLASAPNPPRPAAGLLAGDRPGDRRGPLPPGSSTAI